MVGIEPGRDVLKTDEAADEKSRPDQQHEREGQLGNHQQAAQAVPGCAEATVRLGAPSTGLEGDVKVDIHRANGRSEAEHNSSQDGDAESEGQYAAINSDQIEARNIARVDRTDDVESPLGNQQSGRTTHQPEQHAFSQQLPY